jgi:hypothetical protein
LLLDVHRILTAEAAVLQKYRVFVKRIELRTVMSWTSEFAVFWCGLVHRQYTHHAVTVVTSPSTGIIEILGLPPYSWSCGVGRRRPIGQHFADRRRLAERD